MALAPDDTLIRLFEERAALLNVNEKNAVREYLKYIELVYGAEFPAFGPTQALNYWPAVS